jgi:uncharacterized cupin superfamily protein
MRKFAACLAGRSTLLLGVTSRSVALPSNDTLGAAEMIVRKGEPTASRGGAEHALGAYETLRYSDVGQLKQFGANLETLQPGSRSSERHWHEREDEFLYLISGEATVIENDGMHVLYPGDAACWPAGTANAHCVVNRSSSPCTYLIVGTRPTHDICHYPDAGRALHTDGETWRMVRDDGTVLREGRSKGT